MPGDPQADVDIVAVIDRVPLSRLQWVTIVLCGIVAILDGFDTQAIAFVAPLIAKDMQADMSAFGPVFGSGLLGLTVTDAFSPCNSLKAAARLLALFSTYNSGSPSRGIQYATRVMTTIDEIKREPEPADNIMTREVPAGRQLCSARPEDVWERSLCVTPEEGSQIK